MNKKTLALIAALVLFAAGIAGCTDATPESASAASSEPASESAPEPSPEPTPVIVPEGEPGLHADGSMTMDDGYTLEPDAAQGVYVPLDQVLTYMQSHYGDETIEVLSELMQRDYASLQGVQYDLARSDEYEMSRRNVPDYASLLATLKEVEIETEAAQHYNPNWAAEQG